jgi:hypothetical protein
LISDSAVKVCGPVCASSPSSSFPSPSSSFPSSSPSCEAMSLTEVKENRPGMELDTDLDTVLKNLPIELFVGDLLALALGLKLLARGPGPEAGIRKVSGFSRWCEVMCTLMNRFLVFPCLSCGGFWGVEVVGAC